MTDWIDSSITPSLSNTGKHCVLLMNDDSYHIGFYSFPDGWFDNNSCKEISKEQFKCYMPLSKPRKETKTETIIEWK